jgi:PAS domain-containing protein
VLFSDVRRVYSSAGSPDAFGDSDGLCVVGHRQRILGWNQAAERLLGYWPFCSVHRVCVERGTTTMRRNNVNGDLVGAYSDLAAYDQDYLMAAQ